MLGETPTNRKVLAFKLYLLGPSLILLGVGIVLMAHQPDDLPWTVRCLPPIFYVSGWLTGGRDRTGNVRQLDEV